MNITFLVNHDLASTLALNNLLPKLSHHTLDVIYTKKVPTFTNEQLADLANFEKQTLINLDKVGTSQKFKSLKALSEYTRAR